MALEVDSADGAPADAELDGAPGDGAELDSAPADSGSDAGPFDLTQCRVVASDTVPLPEASGAAMLDEAGRRILLVADSGNAGRALIIDRERGESTGATLPLGDGGDDVEGLERAPDGRIFGLSSNGFLRAWQESADGFELVYGPTPVSDDPAWVCDPFGVNCAANFEGICLHPAPTTHCVGWAASKAKGVLVCLVAEGNGYRVDGAITIPVAEVEQLSGCAFEPDGPQRLLVGGNLYASSAIWVVDPETKLVRQFAEPGALNQETLIMVPGGLLYSFGDAQDLLGDLSPSTNFECRAPAPRSR